MAWEKNNQLQQLKALTCPGRYASPILVYGPPSTGKTTTVLRALLSNVNNFICIHIIKLLR